MKPLIGVTVAHVDEEINTYPREYYVQAVEKAGGVPVLLPIVSNSDSVERFIGLIDGLLLSGGSDVEPKAFGEEPLRGIGSVYAARDKFELEIAKRAVEQEIPILGICKGIQVLNIACGGDIYQDINSQMDGVLEHRQKAPRNVSWHSVNLSPESKLSAIMNKEQIRINSFHHQAVRTVAPGFKIVATAKDGVIEGIESTQHRFVIGVQWHPEAMVEDDTANMLFRALVEACKSK